MICSTAGALEETIANCYDGEELRGAVGVSAERDDQSALLRIGLQAAHHAAPDFIFRAWLGGF